MTATTTKDTAVKAAQEAATANQRARAAAAEAETAQEAARAAQAIVRTERDARRRAWAQAEEAQAWQRTSAAEAAVTEALVRFHEVATADLVAAFAAYVTWREARSAVNVERERRIRRLLILGRTEDMQREIDHGMTYRDGDLVDGFERMVHEAITARVRLTLARQRREFEAAVEAAGDG